MGRTAVGLVSTSKILRPSTEKQVSSLLRCGGRWPSFDCSTAALAARRLRPWPGELVSLNASWPQSYALGRSHGESAAAVLNGTVDPNGISGVEAYFTWGTADGGAVEANWQNVTAHQPVPGDGDRGFEQAIGGLSQSTVYFHRAWVFWP
jgi:hypothetical protein